MIGTLNVDPEPTDNLLWVTSNPEGDPGTRTAQEGILPEDIHHRT